MTDQIKPDKSQTQGNAQQPKPAFQPAANPFATAATTPPAQESSPTKKSLFSFGMGKKKEPPKPPQLTEATVAGKSTTLVGPTAQQGEEEGPPPVPEEILFSWQSPEFAYTNKPIGWFVGLAAFTIVLIVLAILTRQWITIVLLAIMGIALGVWANRKPKVLEYKLSNYGVYVNNKKYLFNQFREFYDFMDYNQKTIDLVPTKRFGTLVSLPLVTPESEEIEETLGRMIPRTEHTEDLIEKLFRKLRF